MVPVPRAGPVGDLRHHAVERAAGDDALSRLLESDASRVVDPGPPAPSGTTVTTFVCIGLLVAGVWPGLLWNLLVVLFIPAFFVLIAVTSRWERRSGRRAMAMPHVAALSLTGLLLWFHVPQRIAFAACRSSFEELIAAAPEGALASRIAPRRIGPYTVDSLGKEIDGPGVYIRVRRDLIGFFDTTSYGFAHRPAGDSSPFGARGYATYPLGDDWHVFEANNDWF